MKTVLGIHQMTPSGNTGWSFVIAVLGPHNTETEAEPPPPPTPPEKDRKTLQRSKKMSKKLNKAGKRKRKNRKKQEQVVCRIGILSCSRKTKLL